MIAGQLIEMLQLQSRVNTLTDPNWLTANHSWPRAIMLEAAEAMDHIGWKWWKHQEPDMPQARIEMIDIWHFVLSQALVDSGGNVQKAALDVMERWHEPISQYRISEGPNEEDYVAFPDMPLVRRLEIFGALAGLTGNALLPMMKDICETMGMNDADLFEAYVTKNVLNIFRQENGYKQGTYHKTWFGQEDNVVMQQIIDDSNGNLSAGGLALLLKEKYAKVVEAANT